MAWDMVKMVLGAMKVHNSEGRWRQKEQQQKRQHFPIFIKITEPTHRVAIISKAAANPPTVPRIPSLPCPDRFFASFPIRYSPSSPLHFSPYRGRLRLRDCAAAAAAAAASLAGVGKCLWKPAILHGLPSPSPLRPS